MRLLVLADVGQQLVGDGVTGGPVIAVLDLHLLGRLPRGQHPFERCQPRLQAEPGRDPHRAWIGDWDTQLLEALLQPVPVPGFAGSDPPQDLGPARVALPACQQLVDQACLDLAAPGVEEPVAGLGVVHDG